jgi:hypothetical protein
MHLIFRADCLAHFWRAHHANLVEEQQDACGTDVNNTWVGFSQGEAVEAMKLMFLVRHIRQNRIPVMPLKMMSLKILHVLLLQWIICLVWYHRKGWFGRLIA